MPSLGFPNAGISPRVGVANAGLGAGSRDLGGDLGTFSPGFVPGLAARYDMSNTANYSTATGVKCLYDLSGNSAVNVLALNGTASNTASAPDSTALKISGADMDIRCYASLAAWGTASNFVFVSKYAGAQRCYQLIRSAVGSLSFQVSTTGADGINFTGSVNLGTIFSAYQAGWVRSTYNHTTGAVTFYWSTDGVNWTNFDSNAGSPLTVFQGTSILTIGDVNTASNIYRAQIYNGIAGTLVFDANFATAGKLAASFTESSANAATVTVNTTGDLGARICGARDLVNLTGANQPTVSGGGALFNGTSQYMQTAGFALSQPVTVFLVGQQVTWVNLRFLYDGYATASMSTAQVGSTPQIIASAGTQLASISPPVATDSVITAVFNASGSLRLNRIASVNGSVGAGNGNAFTLGCAGGIVNFGNIRVKEVLVYAAAHDTATQNRVILYLGRKWGIAV
jgi:hypothetical protein